jgi:hypothetical protein
MTAAQKGITLLLWSEQEDTLLKELYLKTPKDIILTKLNRTWKSIRYRASRLKFKRDPSIIKQDNIEGTKKAMLEKYGVEYSTLLPAMKEKSRQTNLKKRGVEYPSQSKEVRDKIKLVVNERYGVDNVFQAQKIKEKSEQTILKRYGVRYINQSPTIREKTKETNLERYGISNTFQLTDRVEKGMIEKYGQRVPLNVPEIAEKKKKTSLEKYGVEVASKNEAVKRKLSETLKTAVVREKKYQALKKKGSFNYSNEELAFANYLLIADPDLKTHQLHPITKHVIDYYMPRYDLWVQYDGTYWHGKGEAVHTGPQAISIEKIKAKDIYQNENIPNLIRFWSDDVNEAIKKGSIFTLIEIKIKEKINTTEDIFVCHQYRKKIEHYTEDRDNLPFNPDNIKASNFTLIKEELSTEIVEFIKKYEWLETVGVNPKWCFTARYNDKLGGVVLINEPTAYSKMLGKDTPIYEALIQRGATASWTPKNLGSRLVMFSCKWMVANTPKRIFVGYADPSAKERGIIYQACNFDYLGDNFGNSYLYKHPEINRTFTSQYLKRTSTFRRWCLLNKIELRKEWFKENGFKNLEIIPHEIKNMWYLWIKDIISSAERITISKKMKYAILLYRDKKDRKILEPLKKYDKFPYNKIYNTTNQLTLRPRGKNNHGLTADRKNPEKIEFILKNHSTMSRSVMALELNETQRWVKRQVNKLVSENKIKPKR